MVANVISEETVSCGRLQGSLFAPKSNGKLKGKAFDEIFSVFAAVALTG